jgi:hypothetical protein
VGLECINAKYLQQMNVLLFYMAPHHGTGSDVDAKRGKRMEKGAVTNGYEPGSAQRRNWTSYVRQSGSHAQVTHRHDKKSTYYGQRVIKLGDTCHVSRFH